MHSSATMDAAAAWLVGTMFALASAFANSPRECIAAILNEHDNFCLVVVECCCLKPRSQKMNATARTDCANAQRNIIAGNYSAAILDLRLALQNTTNRCAWSKLMLAIRELNKVIN